MREKEAKSLKILTLTTSYPSDESDPSGIFIARLLAAISKRGHAVEVIAPTNGRYHGRRTIDGIETVRFGYFLPHSLEKLTTGMGGIPESMARSRLARFQLFPMMARFLTETLSEVRNCDVIYANWLGAGLIGAAAKALTGKPLVVSFRGDDGYLARDRPIWRVLTSWVMEKSDKVAPVSRELADILVNLGCPEPKCLVPRFGVDVEAFHPGNREPGDEVRVLFVGALIRKKGVADLLAALARQASPHVRLVAVGDGVDAPEFMSLADELGLADRVEWKGVLPHDDVAMMMRECDLLCLPSYTEGRPNVIVEAMASGLPVIATRVGGIPDMVHEGETALLHDPGDVEALSECLDTLAQEPALRSAMGRKARNFVMESGLNWDTTAQDFEIIFSEAVSAGPNAVHAAAEAPRGILGSFALRIAAFLAPTVMSLGLLLTLLTLFEHTFLILGGVLAANLASIALLLRRRQRGTLASSLRMGSCYSVALLVCLLAIQGFFPEYIPGQDSRILQYHQVGVPPLTKSTRITGLSPQPAGEDISPNSVRLVPASAAKTPASMFSLRPGAGDDRLDTQSDPWYVHATQGQGRVLPTLPFGILPETASSVTLPDYHSFREGLSPLPPGFRARRSVESIPGSGDHGAEPLRDGLFVFEPPMSNSMKTLVDSLVHEE